MDELTLTDYLAILRRWKTVFLVIFLILTGLSAGVAMRWSNYRSAAVIQVEPPDVSANAVTSAGAAASNAQEDEANQHIGEIQQRVLSTSSLVEIITKFNLYPEARSSTPVSALAASMRRKVRIEMVNNPAGGKASGPASPFAFTLSFDYQDPLIAQQVADELATRFLDLDLKERRMQAQDTSAFLDTQIKALEESLAEQEKKIAEYQQTHGVARPENLAFNQQAAVSMGLSLQGLESQLTINEGTQGNLRSQLAVTDPYSRVLADGQVLTTPSLQLKALKAQYATLSAQYGSEHPDVDKIRRQISALEAQIKSQNGIAAKVAAGANDTARLKAQIEDARAKLEAAKKAYGPEHPDAVALAAQLKAFEDQLAVAQKAGPAASGIVADADNPAYIQLTLQLKAAESQREALISQRDTLKAQQEAYQKAVLANPETEKELATLTRDHENAPLRYRELKEKKMAADMDQQMQEDRKGQRLSLLEPPGLPLNTQPARKLLLLGGIGASLFGGLIAVLIAQLLAGCIVGPHHLETIVGMPPLVTIPYTSETRRFAGILVRRKDAAVGDEADTANSAHLSSTDAGAHQNGQA